MKLSVLLTGATGMVGEGVLHECLENNNVEKVLIIVRKSTGVVHRKLKEIVHEDFFQLDKIAEHLVGYNTCFFCLGVTSLGLNEEAYHKVTYVLTLNFAKVYLNANPESVFCYISGAGTKTGGENKSMWVRVKGKTEAELLKLPFKRVFLYRPGYMSPMKGMKHTQSVYIYVDWLFPILKIILPNFVTTLRQLAQSMINAVVTNYPQNVIEVADIKKLSL